MANTVAVFSLLFTLSTTFSLLLLLLLPHCIDAQPLKVCKFDAIYQLGDSLSDTGNLIREVPTSTCARLPYGQNFPNNATGRCSNGMLMIDYFGKNLTCCRWCLFTYFCSFYFLLDFVKRTQIFCCLYMDIMAKLVDFFFFFLGFFLLIAVGF